MSKSLGKAVRDQRKKLKISIVRLAERLDMDRTYIHRIENMDFLPSLKVIEKIANELKSPSLVELYFAAKNNSLNEKLLKQRKTLSNAKSEIIKRLKG